MKMRIGFGYDVHQLAKGRKLILGGQEIAFEKGAVAHSDGDVLIHAICDALLGALALGDIGKHFPDSSGTYKNIDSRLLLKKTAELVRQNGYTLANLDSTVCLQSPKIQQYVNAMRENIAGDLGAEINQVSVKATTTEKMGFVGKGKGISAYAVVLLVKSV